ncbi:DUF6950 family protein [Methylopila sp. Yamaguchi]|uniref:DUF6950 family protein n=1 Tax=Methylopila sp. Yamaguchi TaxID=1437817 RepID=UPI000CC6542D|nr:hypothetical protein [Methylopila sp. Yamaguchi]GBD48107.1 hypothetical protein METY_1320 [Methylopila sp. Yamaguchi]
MPMPITEERLDEYLDEVSEDVRFWQDSHCLLFLARWVAVVRPDFALEPLLGRVSGPVSAYRFLQREGGVDAYVSSEAARAGLALTTAAAARLGAIGLVRVPRAKGGDLTFGCIRTASRWSIRTREGLVELDASRIRVQPHLVWDV